MNTKQHKLNIVPVEGSDKPFLDTFVEYDFPKGSEKLTKPEHFKQWFKHLRTNWEKIIDEDFMEWEKDKYDQQAWLELLQSGLVKKEDDGEYWFGK